MERALQAICEGVLAGDRGAVEARVREALGLNVSAEDVLRQGLIAAMTEVGARFEAGEYYVPEMLVAANAMKAGMAVLKPRLAIEGVPALGTVVMGTVKGDLHDIGKNLVRMMLEGSGYQVIDLGVDVAPEKFALAARESQAQIVGMSALLTTTMQSMKAAIEAIDDLGLRGQVKIIVGGAPVTQDYAEGIGADGYAPDAGAAVALTKTLLRETGKL